MLKTNVANKNFILVQPGNFILVQPGKKVTKYKVCSLASYEF